MRYPVPSHRSNQARIMRLFACHFVVGDDPFPFLEYRSLVSKEPK